MRQFTRWAQHLGGFLAHHGVPGFLDNAEDTRDLDEDAAEWRAFLTHWSHLHGTRPLTAKTLRESAEPEFGTEADPWAGTFPTTNSGKPLSVKSLGRKLTGQLDRWRGDIVLRSGYDDHANMRLYWVQQLGDEPTPHEPNPQTHQHPT
jgi:hypothetical protein